jgi:hypothetical protein
LLVMRVWRRLSSAGAAGPGIPAIARPNELRAKRNSNAAAASHAERPELGATLEDDRSTLSA